MKNNIKKWIPLKGEAENEEVTEIVEKEESNEMGFFRRNWKKIAIGAGAIGAGALGLILLKGKNEEDDYDEDDYEDIDETEDDSDDETEEA